MIGLPLAGIACLRQIHQIQDKFGSLDHPIVKVALDPLRQIADRFPGLWIFELRSKRVGYLQLNRLGYRSGLPWLHNFSMANPWLNAPCLPKPGLEQCSDSAPEGNCLFPPVLLCNAPEINALLGCAGD